MAFYLRTGKALAANRRTVTLTFRRPPLDLFPGQRPARDQLVLDLTAAPAATLELNVKQPGPELTLATAGSEFRLTPDDDHDEGVDAYERLILDVMLGDRPDTVRPRGRGRQALAGLRSSCRAPSGGGCPTTDGPSIAEHGLIGDLRTLRWWADHVGLYAEQFYPYRRRERADHDRRTA